MLGFLRPCGRRALSGSGLRRSGSVPPFGRILCSAGAPAPNIQELDDNMPAVEFPYKKFLLCKLLIFHKLVCGLVSKFLLVRHLGCLPKTSSGGRVSHQPAFLPSHSWLLLRHSCSQAFTFIQAPGFAMPGPSKPLLFLCKLN